MAPVATQRIESSRELIARSRAIIGNTRHLIACNRRHLNPWWRLSDGSDEGDGAGELRLSIRRRLERRDLIPAPRRVWAARGTGRRCVVCARDILASEVENEISVRADGLNVRLWAHLPCLTIWREESDALKRVMSGSANDASTAAPPGHDGRAPSAALTRAVRLAVRRCRSDVAQAVTEVLDWIMALPSSKGFGLYHQLTDHSLSTWCETAFRAAEIELHPEWDVPFRDRLVSAGNPERAADVQAEVRRQLYRPLIQLLLRELNRPDHLKGRTP